MARAGEGVWTEGGVGEWFYTERRAQQETGRISENLRECQQRLRRQHRRLAFFRLYFACIEMCSKKPWDIHVLKSVHVSPAFSFHPSPTCERWWHS